MTINRGVQAAVAYKTYVIDVAVVSSCQCSTLPRQPTKLLRSRARSPSEARSGLEDKGGKTEVVAVIIVDRIADEVTGSKHAVRPSIDVGQSEETSLELSTSLKEARLWSQAKEPKSEAPTQGVTSAGPPAKRAKS